MINNRVNVWYTYAKSVWRDRYRNMNLNEIMYTYIIENACIIALLRLPYIHFN